MSRRALVMLVLVFTAGGALAQDTPDRQPKGLQIPEELRRRSQRGNPVTAHQMIELRRRLVELDRLLVLGSLGRAESLLADLAQHSSLERELVTRRIKLAQLQGDYTLAIDLGRAALIDQQRNPGLWRELAVSLLAVSDVDSARVAVDHFIEVNPNQRSAAIVGMDLFLNSGHPAMAVGLIDSMRTVLNEPRFLGRQRAVGLLGMGEQEQAAAEISHELRHNPYNYSLVRTELLEGPYRPAEHRAFLKELIVRANEPAAKGGEALLVTNLLVAENRVPEALEMVEPLYAKPNLVLVLLQNCLTMTRELKLLDDEDQITAAVDYLLAVLGRLTDTPTVDLVMRRRAADYLADTCEIALELDRLGPDPAHSVARFGQLLDLVREVNPASERLYSSQIKLAVYTRDHLHDAAGAARRLEGMLLNPDLPLAGLALVRLSLGESYLAAGDTARGRVVLTRLGLDPKFRQAGGHAHYHLARLDLAEGHFATARDRFAVIALDNPGASYANNALDLGLIIAEEMDNPTGGPDILALYAPAVYAELVARPDERVAALENFVTVAGSRLDPEEPQHLYEKALFELATIYAGNGRTDEALALLQRVVLEHPDGRYPARALHLRGELLQSGGRGSAAGAAWQQLLAQYPDYLFIDDVRDYLRALPN